MLEQKIQELTTAITALIAALGAGLGRQPTVTNVAAEPETPAVETPKKEKKEKPSEEKKEEDAKAKKEEKAKAEAATLKPIQEIVNELMTAGKLKDVQAILKTVGANAGLASIPNAHRANVLKQLEKMKADLTTATETPAAEPAAEPASTPVTRAEVLTFARPLLTPGTGTATPEQRKATTALVEKYKAAKISEISEDKLGAFFPELKAIFEGDNL